VNDALQTSRDHIYAVGDCAGGPQFTHWAEHEARLATRNALFLGSSKRSLERIPWVTFTDPEVGAVGLTEAQAVAAGIDVAVAVKQVPATMRGWLHRTGGEGLIKMVFDRETTTMVGATAVGPHGGEMLGMLGLAVHAKTPLADLRSIVRSGRLARGRQGTRHRRLIASLLV